MLTQRRLSVIRAALRFWSEEMHPYDEDLIATYCNRSRSDDEFPHPEDVEWMIDNEHRLRLRFAVISNDQSEVVNGRLFDSAEAVQQEAGPTQTEIAAMLVLSN